MNIEEATAACNELWMDLPTLRPEKGAEQVIEILVRIAQNKTSPLAAVEAMEILVSLDPEEFWHE